MYPSQNIIEMIKSRSIRWVGYVAHIGHVVNASKCSVGKRQGERTRCLLFWDVSANWYPAGNLLPIREKWYSVGNLLPLHAQS